MSHVSGNSKTVSVLGASVEILEANRNLRCEVNTMMAIDYVVNSLKDAVQVIILLSILRNGEIRAFRAMQHSYGVLSSGFSDVYEFYEIFKNRLIEDTVHAKLLVAAGSGRIPPFTELL